jgi:flagellar protein FliS
MHPARRYAQTQKETASRERLMVMLFEAALRHIRTGIAALEEKRPEDCSTPFLKASDIVAELLSTLDRSRAPELCDQLAVLYSYVCGRLVSASLMKDVEKARDAERAFAPVVEAFATAVASLEGGQVGGPPK